MKSSLLAAPRTSLSWQNFVPPGEGVPLQRGRQRGVPLLKRCYFAAIGSYSMKTVADRYIHAAYHNKHWSRAFNFYQHRWPWTTLNPEKEAFSHFFAIFYSIKNFINKRLYKLLKNFTHVFTTMVAIRLGYSKTCAHSIDWPCLDFCWRRLADSGAAAGWRADRLCLVRSSESAADCCWSADAV